MVKRTAVVAIAWATLLGCHHVQPAKEYWVGTWGTAPQLVEPQNRPPTPGLSGNTLRQIVHVSLDGRQLRLRLSNDFSASPVVITSAHIATSVGESAIDPASDRALSFGGKPDVTIPAHGSVVSDVLSFDLQRQANIAITMHFDSVPTDVTGHPGSRTTSYIQAGDAVTAATLPNAARTDHWYIIQTIDVQRPGASAAVVTLGNSITDGRGSGTNKQNRWPDELARRFYANAATQNVAVLNMGIGGNCVTRACLGPAARARFQRDVLEQSGVRWLIILEGVNDIGGARDSAAAAAVAVDIVNAFQSMITQAHQRGIRVYGATIMPFGGSFYDKPGKESARRFVNQWIRSSGKFDAVIDLDTATRDPAHPTQLLAAYDTGDHLHPNEAGHHAMAAAIDLRLFEGR